MLSFFQQDLNSFLHHEWKHDQGADRIAPAELHADVHELRDEKHHGEVGVSKSEDSGILQGLASQFYSEDHLETILRRAHASGIDLRRLAVVLLWFSAAVPVEGLHPLQAGILRLKSRNERRPGLPPEPWLPFYARQGVEAVRKAVTFVKRWHKLATLRRRIAREDPCRNYTDLALTANGLEDLRLYTQTAEARAAVTRERLVAGLPV